MASSARRAIMVCATKQHTGKTSVSMALFSNLRKHLAKSGGKVGYMKPVGQQWVEVPESPGGQTLRVDKDAALAYQYFGLSDPIGCVSPVVIGRGDTKAFLDDQVPTLSDGAMAEKLLHCFGTLAAANDFVIVEGTGHCGVGSVLGWNNARVAALLGVDVVLVANGGIGSTFDDLALNVLACRAERANIAGIIINKCAPAKVDEVQNYLQRASDRFGWDAPVLACVPYGEDLDKPSVMDLVHLFEGGFSKERSAARYDPSKSESSSVRRGSVLGRDVLGRSNSGGATHLGRNLAAAYTSAVATAAGYPAPDTRAMLDPDTDLAPPAAAPAARRESPAVLLAGAEHQSRRFSQYELVTTSLERFMGRLLDLEKSHAAMEAQPVCFVTHTSRSDVISGLLGHRAIVESVEHYPPFNGGLIIAGSTDHRVSSFIEEYINMANFPILRSNLRMTQTLAAIKDLTPKMQAEDDQRVRHVIELYGPHLEDAVARLVSGK